MHGLSKAFLLELLIGSIPKDNFSICSSSIMCNKYLKYCRKVDGTSFMFSIKFPWKFPQLFPKVSCLFLLEKLKKKPGIFFLDNKNMMLNIWLLSCNTSFSTHIQHTLNLHQHCLTNKCQYNNIQLMQKLWYNSVMHRLSQEPKVRSF